MCRLLGKILCSIICGRWVKLSNSMFTFYCRCYCSFPARVYCNFQFCNATIIIISICTVRQYYSIVIELCNVLCMHTNSLYNSLVIIDFKQFPYFSINGVNRMKPLEVDWDDSYEHPQNEANSDHMIVKQQYSNQFHFL